VSRIDEAMPGPGDAADHKHDREHNHRDGGTEEHHPPEETDTELGSVPVVQQSDQEADEPKADRRCDADHAEANRAGPFSERVASPLHARCHGHPGELQPVGFHSSGIDNEGRHLKQGGQRAGALGRGWAAERRETVTIDDKLRTTKPQVNAGLAYSSGSSSDPGRLSGVQADSPPPRL